MASETGTDENFLLTTSVEVDAPPELVYRFFTEPELIQRWHGVDAESDARPGGRFLLNVTGVDFKVGEFLELDPPRRLVFSWGHPEGVDNFPPGASIVEIEFEPIATGTRIHLHHHHFPSAQHRDGHQVGWHHYLARLALVITGHDPGPDPWRKRSVETAESIASPVP